MREILCAYNAPFICQPPIGNNYGFVYQAPCNHWDCPRCGEMRARWEYGRIVEGCRKLSLDYALFMLTITCKGDTTSLTAHREYYTLTNRLLAAMRYQCRKQGDFWSYVQITEEQKRNVPHAHLITTYLPQDAYPILGDRARYLRDVRTVNSYIPLEMRFTPARDERLKPSDFFSSWLSLEAVKAGLGVQCRISEVEAIEGAARYVSKYMFKSLRTQAFPRGWKRVRYSQSFPKRPQVHSDSMFPLLKSIDWLMALAYEGQFVAATGYVAQVCEHYGLDIVEIGDKKSIYKSKVGV